MKPFPEIAELIEVAKRFVAGEVHFSKLASLAGDLEFKTRAYSAHPSINKWAKEWALMADRCWNEYGQHDDPITETELRDWVREQLAVLEPALPRNDDDKA